MKKREKSHSFVLASTALFLFLITFSSTALAANNWNALAFQDNYVDAIKAYDKAIEINPQDSEAWYNKGIALTSQGNYEEAIKAFDKTIEIDPKNSHAWYNRGVCLECLGKYEEAIKAFDKAIEINPQDSEAWYNKGTCLAHLGKHKEAVEALDKAIELNPQNSQALTLRESILSNSNGLMMSLKSLFSNNNIFVEDENLLEYSQTYLKTYEDVIDESNLTQEDLRVFSFFQGYPYSTKATISTTHGASIMFIPNSNDENRVIKISYPVEELIPRVTDDEKNSNIMFMSVDNSSNITIRGVDMTGGYIYINNSNKDSFYQSTKNLPIILAKGICFNGFTYIESNKLFRDGEFTVNGTLVLNDSKVIMKSNLKKDWTKEKAEEDAIDFLYKGQINGIFDYSKLTGLGFREIETLVIDYNKKENSGYYETNKGEKWKDRQAIFNKANEYGIPYESVLIELLNNKQEKTLPDIIFSLIERLLTVKELAVIVIGIIGLIKRKDIHQKLKKIFS